MTPELATRVSELLRDATMKRKAAREAHDACDYHAENQLINQAIIREGAAGSIDPGHLSPGWHTEQ